MPGSDIFTLPPRVAAKALPKHSGKEEIAPGNAYASTGGQAAAHNLEFIRRDGNSFTLPYSYAPILWWKPPGLLLIEYPGLFSVTLKGRDLGELQRRIRDRRITWVRECEEAVAELVPSAVVRIAIAGFFPSHDSGGGFAD